MFLRPPRYTLFPYTTLFRSQEVSQHVVMHAGDFELPWVLRPPLAIAGIAHRHDVAPVLESQVNAPFGDVRPHPADRKSTRLNSSHLGISYAVFCLKKKNRRM